MILRPFVRGHDYCFADDALYLTFQFHFDFE